MGHGAPLCTFSRHVLGMQLNGHARTLRRCPALHAGLRAAVQGRGPAAAGRAPLCAQLLAGILRCRGAPHGKGADPGGHRMKVAVFHNLPFGGARRALVEWVKGLVRLHEVDLFTYTTACNHDQELGALVRSHYQMAALAQQAPRSLFGKALYAWRLAVASRCIAERINAGSYDLAFVHQCVFFQNPLVMRYLRVPCIFYAQDTPLRRFYEPGLFPRRGIGSTLVEWMKAGVYRRSIVCADRVLTSSCYTRESLKKIYGVDARVVYFGVDTARFRPTVSCKGDYVLSVGRLHFMKGHDLVIRALGDVPASCRPALRIVCEARQESMVRHLTQLAHTCGVRLDFEFGVDDARLIVLYGEALLTICAFIMEPLGFVPLESMACGTPVIGVREAGLRETIVSDDIGLLVHRDPGELAAAVESLLTNPIRYEAMARRGVEYVRKSWTIGRSICDIVAQLEQHRSFGAANGKACDGQATAT